MKLNEEQLQEAIDYWTPPHPKKWQWPHDYEWHFQCTRKALESYTFNAQKALNKALATEDIQQKHTHARVGLMELSPEDKIWVGFLTAILHWLKRK